MNFLEMIRDMPDGDLRVELEMVDGGWVGYVWLSPVSGPIVPAGRTGLFSRTGLCETREEAVLSLPGAFDHIKVLADARRSTSEEAEG